MSGQPWDASYSDGPAPWDIGGPQPTGPHPVGQEQLRAAFNPGSGWNIAAIEADRVQTRYHDDGAPAGLVTIKRNLLLT